MVDNDMNIEEFPVSKSLCTAALDAFKASRITWNEKEVWYTEVDRLPVYVEPRFRKMKDTPGAGIV
jgi:hypothetical protein